MDIAPPTASEELAVGAQVGEYRIQGTLAVGGMATIYAAVHPVIGKKAAIKVISSELSFSPDAVERFLFEARSVNEIGDPNIVDIFGFGTLPDGRVYLVMEWLVGETLAARCCFEFLTLRETVHIVRTIARTLQTVHECGFIHRDLKPDNVFLASRRNETRIVWPYEVKLLDFGIAKLAAGGDEQLTQSGVIVGTPRYVSPEQARGGAIDARTDIYSLGVLTYELLVGDAPFSADSAIELMAKHIHQPPPSLRVTRPEISVGLDDLVLRMLAKDPADRPSLAECRRRLDAALDPEATVLLQVPVAPTPRPDSAVFTPPPGRFPRTERFPREPDARSHRMTPWAPRPASGARIGLVMVLGIVVVLSAVLVGAALLDSRSAARAVVERDLPATPIAPPRPAQVAPPEPEVLAPVRQKPAPHRRRAKRPATKPPAQARGPVPLR